MGVMNINVSEELIEDPVGTGKVGGLMTSEDVCKTEWSILVKTTTSVWVEYVIAGGTGSVDKISGNLIAVNGETLTEVTTYNGIIQGYQSYDENQNNNITQITFTLKDADGGNVLDTQTFTRLSNGNYC
tara:strand:+ start:9391 stop:9777 length:387 start_codon:yes stop_codon:yes gene_type:complete